jgi:thiol-disulfide isomerase/thioredoxin
MKTKIKKYAKEIITLFFTVIVASNLISLYKSRDLSNEALLINSVKLINNQTYTINSNKPILLHFWATWCPVCKAEAPNIQKLSENFNVITIAVKSGTNSEISNWLTKNNYTYNVVNDKHGQLASHFNISVFPTTFIYDRNKKLIFSEVGYTSTIGLWLRMLWASS